MDIFLCFAYKSISCFFNVEDAQYNDIIIKNVPTYFFVYAPKGNSLCSWGCPRFFFGFQNCECSDFPRLLVSFLSETIENWVFNNSSKCQNVWGARIKKMKGVGNPNRWPDIHLSKSDFLWNCLLLYSNTFLYRQTWLDWINICKVNSAISLVLYGTRHIYIQDRTGSPLEYDHFTYKEAKTSVQNMAGWLSTIERVRGSLWTFFGRICKKGFSLELKVVPRQSSLYRTSQL